MKYNRRYFIRKSAAMAAGVSVVSCLGMITGMVVISCKPEQNASQSSLPNIVFIIADQWSPLASDGSGTNRYPRTPGINALAANGIMCSRAYSSFPVCSPARVSMFTGRMPHQFGVTGNFHDEDKIDADYKTMGELFHAAGYETGYFGKDHTAGGTMRGFEVRDINCRYGGGISAGSVFDPLATKLAVKFIEENSEKPFFLTLSLINPHDICTIEIYGKPSYGGSFVNKGLLKEAYEEVELPVNHKDTIPEAMCSPRRADYVTTEEQWKEYLRFYYLMIENTDWNITQVMNALGETGVKDNTLVVFLTDHGDMMSAHRMRQKDVFFEEAARINFILSYPKGIKSPAVFDGLASTIDLMPTICDYAGISIPQPVDGMSLRPAFEDENAPWREYLVSEIAVARMVRFADYKYVRSDIGEEVLYNLANDPGEGKDISKQEDMKPLLERARMYLKEWSEKTNDSFPQESTSVQNKF